MKTSETYFTMELHKKLKKKYQERHLSLSTTQTTIEEAEQGAITENITIEHAGTEVLKISKNLLSEVRDEINNKNKEAGYDTNKETKDVCDGVIATSTDGLGFVGYFELKSACSTNNVLKARKQILDSQHHWWTIAAKCSINMLNYTEKGIIITQPLTEEIRLKIRRQRQRDDERGIRYSSARFFHKLLVGKAIIDETGMPLLHFNAGEAILLERII